jgi:hypothetical protein
MKRLDTRKEEIAAAFYGSESGQSLNLSSAAFSTFFGQRSSPADESGASFCDCRDQDQ